MPFVLVFLFALGLLVLFLPPLLIAVLFYEYQKIRPPVAASVVDLRTTVYEPGYPTTPRLAAPAYAANRYPWR
ncbi:MAG: hypothetical protein M3Z66_14880 [Chloroflexota bacterium]|nr:hypothetical protein [Chloroflexota bacterium]